MKTCISSNEFYLFNRDVISNFTEILVRNDAKMDNKLDNLISDWSSIYNQSITGNIILITDFLSKWYEAKEKDNNLNHKDSHNFNILRMFHICETSHSKLLKLLLNPNGDHGQGNFFLSLFLKEMGIKEPSQGDWKVTAEEGRIDLLLKRKEPLSIVVIENKSNRATDQPNQLYRYWNEKIFYEYP